MKFWISRDKGYDKQYDLWTEKPLADENGNYAYRVNTLDTYIEGFHSDVFHRLTDIRLKPGECRGFESVFTIKKKRGGK
jgi:hypothetical protein